MKGRWKKFLSYYTNYKVLFFKDMKDGEAVL